MTPSVAVIVPTLNRPANLERALRSLFAQEAAWLIDEIAVVDNSTDGSAEATVAALRPLSPCRLTYVPCPRPGVATARNAGLAATTAPLIGFLDDDEAAPPGWLGALHAAHIAFAADVTFGPVQGRCLDAPAWKRAYLDAFFSRTGPAVSGMTETVYGCGNSMMTRATALAGAAPFDVAANEIGGEDDRLFQRLKAERGRFAWAADAWVWEDAPTGRATVRYTLARAVSYGQTPPQLAAQRGSWSGVVKWMAIGAGQAVAFALAAVLLAPFSPTRALSFADRSARGFGKVVWFRKLRFYGQAAVKKGAKTRAPAPGSAVEAASATG